MELSPRLLALLLVFYQLVAGAKALLAPGNPGGLPQNFPLARMAQIVAPEYQLGDEKPYRIGVVAVFVNDSGDKVLTCKKRQHNELVFPQGGVEKGETFEQTLYREVLEEIGNNEFDIIRKADNLMSYEFRPLRRFEFRGQMQQWYLCHFKPGMGPDLDKTLDVEFVAFNWVSPEKAVEGTLHFKKPTYEEGLSALGFKMDYELNS
jgi:putative (di)nucleoside polyphosphate hydrolase